MWRVMLYHRIARRSLRLGASAFVLGLGLAAPQLAAQDSEGERADSQDERIADDLHDRRVDPEGTIVVTAAGLRQLDVLAGTSVFEAEELQRNLSGQVGEVLVKLPGVSATGFSPGASRPVLRGFSGERVRVLIDGIGAIDASNTSDDHAVTLDPLSAERIEVLRGPAVLLYGSQAIGGAVNIIDKRIPRRIPDEPVHIDALFGLDTAMDTRQAGASLDMPLGGGFVAHLGGSWRKTDDLEVAGFTVSPILRAELLEEAAEEEAEGEFEEADELREAAEQRGVLPNSATETFSADAGVSFFADGSMLGVALGIFDTRYGVPGRPGAGHHHGEEEEGEEEPGEAEEEERVTIDMRQYRADLRGELDLGGGFFEMLRLRSGFSDYTHTEFEGDEVGTVFDVTGIETRAELVQRRQAGWGGSLGLQYTYRDFDAFGAEAYVAPNETEQVAIFALQEYGPGPIQLEGALRYENTSVKSVPLDIQRDFDTFSAALGVAWESEEAFRIGANISRVARAPSAEELFSDGPHIATQAFEIGDVNLAKEKAWNVEGFARGKIGRTEVNFAVFRSWFDDYIYLAPTGLEEDDLPVFTYLQSDARYFGLEGEVVYTVFDNGPMTLLADVRGDYVRASLADGSPIPRIPPVSLLGALELQTTPFDARVEVQWFGGQDRVAAFETPSESFTFVNASVEWRPLGERENVTVLFQAENIFDTVGRRHASFTKDFVPLAGRNLKASVRLSF